MVLGGAIAFGDLPYLNAMYAAAAYTINAADYPSFGLITASGTETVTWGTYTAAAR